jgi:hypothetical protein
MKKEKKLFDNIMKNAVAWIESRPEDVPPVLFILTKDGEVVIADMSDNSHSAKERRDFMALTAKEIKNTSHVPIALVFASQAYVVSRKNDKDYLRSLEDNTATSPSNSPDRTECLIVSGLTKDGESAQYIGALEIENGKPRKVIEKVPITFYKNFGDGMVMQESLLTSFWDEYNNL